MGGIEGRRSRWAIGIPFILLVAASLSMHLAAQVVTTSDGETVSVHVFRPPVSPGKIASPNATVPGTHPGISLGVEQQITAMMAEKQARTAVQQKIDSKVLHTVRMLRGNPVAPGVPYLETGVEIDDSNNLLVDIIGDISESVLNRLRGLGGRIVDGTAVGNSVRALVPFDQIEQVASWTEVRRIWPRRRGMVRGIAPAEMRFRPGFRQRSEAVRSFLIKALPLTASIGSTRGTPDPSLAHIDSQGDTTHKAILARATYGATGSGVKIGVLSDSVLNLAQSQALGRLGTVTVLPNQAGGSDGADEGTAMLEIIHDLAPNVQLYFATGCCTNVTNEKFAANIRALRTAGCDIIVDDVGFSNESPFQDGQKSNITSDSDGGVITQAVNDVVADGAMYFSAGGNAGNLDQGTSGTWEGDFVDGGPVAGAIATSGETGRLHLYNATSLTYNTVTSAPYVDLFWTDPLGDSTNDYDLFLLDSTGTTVTAVSNNRQAGAGWDPWEELIVLDSSQNPTPLSGRLVVVKYSSGPGQFLHIAANGGTLSTTTTGEVHGHCAASGAFTVAATPAYLPYDTSTATGPYPNPFNSTNVTESYSSDGPRLMFFQADGTPFTPGNFSSSGGQLIYKPDFTAADGVSVVPWGPFPSPFYGTSAAGPHAAAIAALLKSANPAATNAQIGDALTASAVNIMSVIDWPNENGWDQNSGAGILLADAAVASIGPPAQANLDVGTVTATESQGNGDGIISPGESGQVTVQLNNLFGSATASGISATLATSTTGVTITQATSAYPDIAAGGTASNTTPFTFSLASNFNACATSVDFTLTVNYTGGATPSRVLNLSVPIGPSPLSIDAVLGAPPSVPGLGVATGTQTGRVDRSSGTGSTCLVPKTWPGFAYTSGSRTYDSYTFTACRTTCAAIAVSPSALSYGDFYSVAYNSATFNPASINSNYAGDAGYSNLNEGYSIHVTQGQSYTVVVHSVGTTGSSTDATGQPYNLKIATCALDWATQLAVSAPATASYGTAFSFTVTAQDQSNNTVTGYSGTVHFTSSDPAESCPPTPR